MALKNLFDFYYWFGQPFVATGLILWFLVGGFLALIVAGLILRIASQYSKQKSAGMLFKRLSALGIVMGFLGLLWMFFRQENTWFLSWRFWLLLWLVLLMRWIYRIIRYVVKRMPEIKAEQEKKERMEKYLPKGNH